MNTILSRNRFLLPAFMVLLCVPMACQTHFKPEPIDLSRREWSVREGNAIWKSSPEADDLVTDIIFAEHENGRVWLQVSKDVLPMVTVHILEERWIIESPARGRNFSGTGALPGNVLWAQLAGALAERITDPVWTWRPDALGGTLENSNTGEMARIVFVE